VFINGKLIGPGGAARAPSVYDVKALLQPGPNTIAVAIANYGAAAGLNQGVELRLHDEPPAPAWSRSTLNGLAQIIVRTTKQPGALVLSARAAGLAAATLPLAATPATPRPSVE
jgi:beta-galactosidase